MESKNIDNCTVSPRSPVNFSHIANLLLTNYNYKTSWTHRTQDDDTVDLPQLRYYTISVIWVPWGGGGEAVLCQLGKYRIKRRKIYHEKKA